jgi:hypothetical protein
MILYETREDFGHWILLSKLDKDNLRFFDPYGLGIDEELKLATYNRRIHNNQIVPHLTHLLKQSTYNVQVNKTRYQKILSHVNTCGRWTAVRSLFSNLDAEKFKQLMKGNKYYDGDVWVTALTIAYSL